MAITTSNNPLFRYHLFMEEVALYRVYDLAQEKLSHLPEVRPMLSSWLDEFPDDVDQGEIPRRSLRLRGKHANALHGLCSELVLEILTEIATLEDPTTADTATFRTLYEIKKATDDLERIAHALR